MLILVLAANTSFADFPRLASFHAGDAFMPKQLTKRGHRLVFSNGILALACTSAVLVVITGARVDHLIPLYAVGVFTSFTMSQAGHGASPHPQEGARLAQGPVRERHRRGALRRRRRGDHRHEVQASGPAPRRVGDPRDRAGDGLRADAYSTGSTKSESKELAADVRAAAEAPVFHRHTVLLLVDELDRSAAKGIQYAAEPVAGRGPRRARRHRPREGRAAHERVAAARPDAASPSSSSTAPTDGSSTRSSRWCARRWPTAGRR